MEKLPISIGILGWNSNNSSLPNTLFSYLRNGFLDMSDDITIFFQEIKEEDIKLANYFNIKYIGADTNVGIANAFHRLVENAKYENFLILEHDWYLQENFQTTYDRIKSSINLLNNDFDCIKLRSMSRPGFTDFSVIRYMDNPLGYFDEELKLPYPHLLDTCHIFKDIHKYFPNEISQIYDDNCMYYTSSSRYGNYTNNPCMYKTKFFKSILEKFLGDKDSLEGLISRWWAHQNFKVAHSEGLFTHFDIVKYAPYWETINHYVKEKGLLK
jgi:hypothetical protein